MDKNTNGKLIIINSGETEDFTNFIKEVFEFITEEKLKNNERERRKIHNS